MTNKTQQFLRRVLVDPELRARLATHMLDRFVEDANGCWNWTTKAVFNHGYGAVRTRREDPAARAHVLSFIFKHGRLPNGHVCHSCDNPSCFNPDHLFEGTSKDNTQDAISKGRLKFPPTFTRATHPRAKLTDEDCVEICNNTIDPAEKLAKKYGVSGKTIRLVRREYRAKETQ